MAEMPDDVRDEVDRITVQIEVLRRRVARGMREGHIKPTEVHDITQRALATVVDGHNAGTTLVVMVALLRTLAEGASKHGIPVDTYINYICSSAIELDSPDDVSSPHMHEGGHA